jgi:hypothetical protein
MAGSQEALDRFERQTALLRMVLALAIIPLLVLPLVFDLNPAVESTFFALDWFIWAAFVLEYGIRLSLAPGKRYFASHNIIDLLFVLIPFLRPFRIVRSVRGFSLLRAFSGDRHPASSRQGREGRGYYTQTGLHAPDSCRCGRWLWPTGCNPGGSRIRNETSSPSPTRSGGPYKR